jgi:flagellar biosynthesis chaperone FliJ
MKDNKQISIIITALDKQRERYLSELARINLIIKNKEILIKKMHLYINEYQRNDQLNLSKSIPIFFNNFNMFIHKIENVIAQTHTEVNQHLLMRKNAIEQIKILENKIKIMSIFSQRIIEEKLLQMEKSEQLTLDDIVAVKHLKEQT